MSETFAVVTGGGTAGHVLPALAVAEALVDAGHPPSTVHYVGTTRGVETRLVPPTGHPYTLLDVVGLQRSLSRRNLAVVPKVVRATRAAIRLLRELEPRVVVNLGGYGSFPATYAARRLGIPYVVVSYDRRPGLVSRVMAGRAAACAVAFEGSTLPRAVHTGAPVRRGIVAVDRVAGRDAARVALGLPLDRTVVAVVCGSLGATVVNRAVVEAVELLSARSDLAVYHAVGERNLVEPAPERDGASGILYRVIGYEQRMEAVYAAADLMVTRAGAGTIAELATVGMPAIVVPWPDAAENHQVDNARVLADVGGAVLLEQVHLDGRRLAEEITRLVDDPSARRSVAAAAWDAGAMHRSTRLVALLERVAR
jgi:undecaprenyldiphospho-muramoylpentapeptide beta-N-acetylglucosaminyltransferase